MNLPAMTLQGREIGLCGSVRRTCARGPASTRDSGSGVLIAEHNHQVALLEQDANEDVGGRDRRK